MLAMLLFDLRVWFCAIVVCGVYLCFYVVCFAVVCLGACCFWFGWVSDLDLVLSGFVIVDLWFVRVVVLVCLRLSFDWFEAVVASMMFALWFALLVVSVVGVVLCWFV